MNYGNIVRKLCLWNGPLVCQFRYKKTYILFFGWTFVGFHICAFSTCLWQPFWSKASKGL